jgi:2-oxoglutarate ferredoxin oxidoreductase subunit delta
MEDRAITPAPGKQRKIKGKVEIDIQRCKGCELCAIECKEHALALSYSINSKGYRYIVPNNDLCTGCVNCALVCPDAVITVYRTTVKKMPQNIRATIEDKQLSNGN